MRLSIIAFVLAIVPALATGSTLLEKRAPCCGCVDDPFAHNGVRLVMLTPIIQSLTLISSATTTVSLLSR